MKNILFILILLMGCYNSSNDDIIKVSEFIQGNAGFFDYIDTGVSFRQGTSPSIMIFGDSRMYGGGTFDGFQNTVFNAAYPRVTTKGIIARLHYYDEYHPDIIIIGAGVCDSWMSETPEEYIKNIKEIINHCSGSRVFVLSIPQTVFNLKTVDEYNALLSELPEFVQINITPDMMDLDGIHFNYKAYEEITAQINSHIH